MKYKLRMLRHINFDKLNNIIKEISKKNNKSKIYIFFDMLFSYIKHGSGYYDYYLFDFINLNEEQRKTMVTRSRNKKLISLLNDKKYTDIFDNKSEFDKLFAEFLNRDILILKESNYDDFIKFMKNKEEIIAKPNSMEAGKGIRKLNKNNYKTLKDMYNDILNDKNLDLLEELIKQNKVYAKFNPESVNCLRIVTVIKDEKVFPIYCMFKIGNNDFRDNYHNGGICCMVDMTTGKIITNGKSSKENIIIKHPTTNVKFKGQTLPHVADAVNMVIKAAKVIPEVGIVGWDVFVNEKGPGIIEGNNYPSYDFPQFPEFAVDKVGTWKKYKEIIKELK